LLIQTICEEMEMKSKKEIKTSKILEKNENLKNSKMSKNSDENNFVCKQNDKDCWHRYSSAMGDCV
jgi:hypothetical protein